jgi:hypothetical protein
MLPFQEDAFLAHKVGGDKRGGIAFAPICMILQNCFFHKSTFLFRGIFEWLFKTVLHFDSLLVMLSWPRWLEGHASCFLEQFQQTVLHLIQLLQSLRALSLLRRLQTLLVWYQRPGHGLLLVVPGLLVELPQLCSVFIPLRECVWSRERLRSRVLVVI